MLQSRQIRSCNVSVKFLVFFECVDVETEKSDWLIEK